MPRRVIVLGATGSIGRQTLDVIRESAGSEERLELAGFSVHSNRETLMLLKHEFPQSKAAWTGEPSSAPEGTSWIGPDALTRLFSETKADIVVNGIAGAAGLSASILVLQSAMHLALANKESIVMDTEPKSLPMSIAATSSLSTPNTRGSFSSSRELAETSSPG